VRPKVFVTRAVLSQEGILSGKDRPRITRIPFQFLYREIRENVVFHSGRLVPGAREKDDYSWP
jgi:hypothetical protein